MQESIIYHFFDSIPSNCRLIVFLVPSGIQDSAASKVDFPESTPARVLKQCATPVIV
jgi:hypothetical protein